MKRNVIISLLILSLAGFMGSCRSKKITQQSYYDYTGQGNTGPRTFSKEHEEKDQCEIESLNEPAEEYRSYGSAIDEDRDFARQMAVFNAKVALAQRVEEEMIATIISYKEHKQQAGIASNEQDTKTRAASKAKTTLTNCRIICSERFRISDGTYECVVCIATPAFQVDQAAKAFVAEEVQLAGGTLDEKAFLEARKNKRDEFIKERQKRK